MKKIINNHNKQLIILVSSILILFWFVASLLLINRVSFTVITDKVNNLDSYSNTFNVSSKKVFKGNFKAQDNNLGILIISFNAFKADPKENRKINFKLKEGSDKNWSFTKSYDASLFDSQKNFSFGLPVISNSKDKNYQFEVSIDRGRNDLRVENPNQFLTGYKYSKQQLKDIKILTHFLLFKTLSSFSDPQFILRSLIYLTPFFTFIIFVASFKKIYPLKRFIKYSLPILLLAEFTFPDILGINIFYVFILLWIIIIFTFKLKSAFTFFTSFVLLLIWILIIPLNTLAFQNELNVVVYSLLLLGAIQLLIEEKSKK